MTSDKEDVSCISWTRPGNFSNYFLYRNYQVEFVNEVEEPSYNKQNLVVVDSHDQDTGGATGGVEGKPWTKKETVWDHSYLSAVTKALIVWGTMLRHAALILEAGKYTIK